MKPEVRKELVKELEKAENVAKALRAVLDMNVPIKRRPRAGKVEKPGKGDKKEAK